jgi:hypothetical protein
LVDDRLERRKDLAHDSCGRPSGRVFKFRDGTKLLNLRSQFNTKSSPVPEWKRDGFGVLDAAGLESLLRVGFS